MLGKAQFHVHETLPDGRPRYDLVILDSPATGHGLEMLRVPKVLLEVAPPGLLRREAERAWELFTDPTRSGLMLVTLPEEMPVSESVELYDALTNELGLPVAGIAVNGMMQRLFSAEDAALVAQLSQATAADDLIYNLIKAGRRRTLRETVQSENLERVTAEFPVQRYLLPQLMVPELRRAGVETLSRAFG